MSATKSTTPSEHKNILVLRICQEWRAECALYDKHIEKKQYDTAQITGMRFDGWLAGMAAAAMAVGNQEASNTAWELAGLWIYRTSSAT